MSSLRLAGYRKGRTLSHLQCRLHFPRFPSNKKLCCVVTAFNFSIFSPFFLPVSCLFLLLCFLHSFFLSIFFTLAIPSPTHACHRRSGGSSLISEAAKNRGRQNERSRQRLCSFNGEEIANWNVCGSTACLANWSHASLCLNSGIRGLICLITLILIL